MSSNSAPNYEQISPYSFVKHLPDFAKNEIPAPLQAYSKTAGFEPWQLLEEGVFFFFRQIMMLETIKMGGNTLFKHEPEGIVLFDRCSRPFSLLYECKARQDGYTMSSDDTLRYKDYIRDKRHQIKVKYYTDLTHFVVVSSKFAGDTEARCKTFDEEGVVLSYCSANYIQAMYQTVTSLGFAATRLLDLRHLFQRGLFDPKCINVAAEKVKQSLNERNN